MIWSGLRRVFIFLLWTLAVSVLFTSCFPTRRLSDDQVFIKKNKVVFAKGSKKVYTDELESIIKQPPNRSILGSFYFYLGMHNLGNKKSETKRNKKFNQWLMDIGEAPVVLDTFLTSTTDAQMELFMRKHGYFNASVDFEIKYYRKGQKAKIKHIITPDKPFTINKINYDIEDTSFINTFLPAARSGKRLVWSGDVYNEDQLEAERNRMSNYFKNEGFFRFSKEYIFFEADSTVGQYKVDLRLVVKNPYIKKNTEKGNEFVEAAHKRYYINNVYVITDYDRYLLTPGEMDTIFHNGVYMLYHEKLKIKPELLSKSLRVTPYQLYRNSDVSYTQGRLAALKNFKFINIRFEERIISDKKNYLDATINLTASERQSFGFETDVTHRTGNLGVNGNLVYRNRNLFRGAEILELRLKGGIEAVQLSDAVVGAQSSEVTTGTTTQSTALSQNNLFNTREYGLEASVIIPELWIPKLWKGLPEYEKPETNLNLAINSQNRPDFRRQLLNANISYKWNSNAYNNYIIHPIDLSVINIDKAAFFEDRLELIDNPFLTASYSNHLIASSKFSYTYSDVNLSENINFNFFQTNFESAGNTLRLLSPAFNLNQNAEGGYELAGIRFAQYLKLDADYRRYNVVNKWSKMVYRIYTGAGIPLTNLDVLPFEKSFFGGGSNNQRGWAVRSLGPGAMPDTVLSVDQIGEIIINANLEYRFHVVGTFNGALFADIGNIWLLNPDPQRPLGHFEWNRFYKEMAVSAGFGARFDLSFFVIRLDAAVQLADPRHAEGERWVFSDKSKTQAYIDDFLNRNPSLSAPDPTPGFFRLLNFNFGIGYPF